MCSLAGLPSSRCWTLAYRKTALVQSLAVGAPGGFTCLILAMGWPAGGRCTVLPCPSMHTCFSPCAMRLAQRRHGVSRRRAGIVEESIEQRSVIGDDGECGRGSGSSGKSNDGVLFWEQDWGSRPFYDLTKKDGEEKQTLAPRRPNCPFSSVPFTNFYALVRSLIQSPLQTEYSVPQLSSCNGD